MPVCDALAVTPVDGGRAERGLGAVGGKTETDEPHLGEEAADGGSVDSETAPTVCTVCTIVPPRTPLPTPPVQTKPSPEGVGALMTENPIRTRGKLTTNVPGPQISAVSLQPAVAWLGLHQGGTIAPTKSLRVLGLAGFSVRIPSQPCPLSS